METTNPAPAQGRLRPMEVEQRSPHENNLSKPAMLATQLFYPEIYYRIQPIILMVCDQFDCNPNLVPTQELMEQLTDSIYIELAEIYPDLMDHNYNQMVDSDSPMLQSFGFYTRRFRHRGSLRELIAILLLTEYARRRM